MWEQFDIKYIKNDVCGWVPDAWTRNEYGPDGTVQDSNEIQVVEMRLNAAQRPEEFDIVFPPSTVVMDIVNNKVYQVQPDGKMRDWWPGGAPRGVRSPYKGVLAGVSLIVIGILVWSLKHWREHAKLRGKANPT